MDRVKQLNRVVRMAKSHRRLPFTMALGIALMSMAAGPLYASGFSPGDGLIGGISAGWGGFTGSYATYLEGAKTFGADLSHPLPFAELPLLVECGFAVLSGRMKESDSSRLRGYSLQAGVLGFYPFHKRFYPFAGIMVQESYLKFWASRIDETESAFKPGAGLRAGFFSPITRSFGLRAVFDYRATPLSKDTLKYYTLGIAAVARLPFGDIAGARPQGFFPAYDAKKSKERAELFVSSGLYELEKGNPESAEVSFKKALDIDPENQKAAAMLGEIDAARASHALARSLVKNKRYYDAIPLLERSPSWCVDAAKELSEIRAMLAAEIPALERIGIAAYETHNYDECIAIMKRIRLIDPDNNTARLYLPRAEGRKRAIERLR